jgi:hypothetical protein
MNYLIYLLFFIPSDSCRDVYLSTILKTPIEHEYYLVVKTENEGVKYSVVLSNVDLYHNLKMGSKKIDSNVIRQIRGGEFILTVTDSTKLFGIVKYNKTISKIKKKGKKYFIDYFFDKYGSLKDNVTSGQTLEQIMEILFNWNVLVSEAEGNIYIDRKRFCDNSLPKLSHE